MKITDENTLWPGVKNYHFIYGNDGPAQFVLTWGTTGYPFKVHDKSARTPNTAVLLWGFHPKTGKKVLLKEAGKMEVSPEGKVKYGQKGEGFFMEYDDTKIDFGRQYRSPRMFAPAGLPVGTNEYRKFSGKLFGHAVKGKGLLQLYKVGFPFASWDWVRFNEPEDCEIFRILNMSTKFDFGGRQHQAVLSAKAGRLHLKGNDVDIHTEPYAREDVFMTGLGKFRYTEFFVKLKGRIGSTRLDTYGIVEEARGFIV